MENKILSLLKKKKKKMASVSKWPSNCSAYFNPCAQAFSNMIGLAVSPSNCDECWTFRPWQFHSLCKMLTVICDRRKTPCLTIPHLWHLLYPSKICMKLRIVISDSLKSYEYNTVFNPSIEPICICDGACKEWAPSLLW